MLENKKLYFISLTIFSLIFSLVIISRPSLAKEKIILKKKISSVEKGEKKKIKIQKLPKKYKLIFISKNKKILSVGKKTGIVKGKKRGKAKILIKLLEKNKILAKKIIKIKVTKKKSLKDSIFNKKNDDYQVNGIPNTNFEISKTINPMNHSLFLKSSRILLESEVKNTSLSLKKEGMDKIHADFYSLSDKGKTLCYRINNTSFKAMCPGDGSADGKYTVSANI